MICDMVCDMYECMYVKPPSPNSLTFIRRICRVATTPRDPHYHLLLPILNTRQPSGTIRNCMYVLIICTYTPSYPRLFSS